MKRPSNYPVVVYITFGTMICCYAVISSMAYIVYGGSTSGNLMHNLPEGDPLTFLVRICVACTVIAKLAQSCAPLMDGFLEWTRLLLYLITHNKYFSSLGCQAPRHMPRLSISTHQIYSPSMSRSLSRTGSREK
eukprot:CAMPEP_0173220082 /NCGR_PEP_ID=MMETSP1142-20121109/1956_1 /TAXON_ID=483371 /ORGANISM="non described non described, Strain CCMP2298" /LENGTH=133 /DNA_ID=CAMNT_0014147939 /DNA_START=138 /DNA_END=536 /DNA_ORIENTATION=-